LLRRFADGAVSRRQHDRNSHDDDGSYPQCHAWSACRTFGLARKRQVHPAGTGARSGAGGGGQGACAARATLAAEQRAIASPPCDPTCGAAGRSLRSSRHRNHRAEPRRTGPDDPRSCLAKPAAGRPNDSRACTAGATDACTTGAQAICPQPIGARAIDCRAIDTRPIDTRPTAAGAIAIRASHLRANRARSGHTRSRTAGRSRTKSSPASGFA
jgi:hypothetical protein